MRGLIGLAWLLLATAAAPVSAQEPAPAATPAPTPAPIVIADASALPLQVERMALLRDATRRLDLAQVRAAHAAPGSGPSFVLAPPGIPNLGTGRDAVWARFAVHNASGAPLPLVLALTDARTAQVSFWALDAAGQIIAQRRDGRLADPAERDRRHRWFLFDLPVAADATATVYLRILSDTGRRLDLRLTDRARLATADRDDYARLALFLGALLFMLAYNLLLLLQLRDTAYLWLCCLIAGAIIWVTDREGLLTSIAWRVWPDRWSGINVGMALGLTGIFLFPVARLRLRQLAPRWVRVHWALFLLAASLLPLGLWFPALGYALGTALGAIAAPAMLVAGLLVLPRQPWAGAWYLASWLPMLGTMFVVTSMNYGLLPAWPVLFALPYLGLFLMLLLLSVDSAERVNRLRRQAEQAQAVLARNEERLTELVALRTRALALARDRAEAASRAKTRFLANLSHDLRTPLNAVLGGAGLLHQSPRLGPEDREQCGLIERGGRHLLRLVEDLLDVAMIEHGRLRPVLGTLALRPLLEDLAAVTRRQATAKGLTFDLRLAADLPVLVRTDGPRLRQLLHNLLDNAVKYTDAGHVRLSAAPDSAAAGSDPLVLCLQVSDTGRGIAPADRERLFAPFEQYHHSQTGSGLGLAICRELADLLGGELTLSSRPGCGSRFRLRLPVHRVELPSEQQLAPQLGSIIGYRGPIRRILVLDDSAANRLLLAAQLRRLGFDVDTAADAAAALASAAEQPPDLVIADLRMPEVCGYAATWQLREALGHRALPAIAASASPLPAPGDAAALGFDAFLLKPIEQGALCAALGACLGLHWLRAEPAATAAAGPPLPALRPPCIELEAARELAADGQWAALRDWSAELDEVFPECADFRQQVRELLDAIDRGADRPAAVAALQQLLAERG